MWSKVTGHSISYCGKTQKPGSIVNPVFFLPVRDTTAAETVQDAKKCNLRVRAVRTGGVDCPALKLS